MSNVQYDYNNLYYNYRRNTVFEFLMLCLMMPCFHAEPCAYTAAEHGEPQQSCLRHTPFGSLRLQLVDAVQKERHDVNAREVNQDNMQQVHFRHADGKYIICYFLCDEGGEPVFPAR